METREKTEYKVYILELANMHGGIDKASPVGVFTSLDKLKTYYNNELAESPWVDENWHKVFKKGSPLEWYNGADSLEVATYRDCAFGGVREEWADFYPTRDSISSHLIFE